MEQAPQQTLLPPSRAWEAVDRIVWWLDEQVPARGRDRILARILKIAEEAGEVAEAVHGTLGTNPRKGRSHTWDDVRAELCDVLVTTMTALASHTPNPQKITNHSPTTASAVALHRDLLSGALAIVGSVGRAAQRAHQAADSHHDWDAVQADLADTITITMTALTALNPDPHQTLLNHLDHITTRAGLPPDM